ncbi:MAG: hypothetical protein KDC44_00845 [Phaeodactylibacter sp.]|nr:hypothetical protein [Phaeodactylibacter sp.]
MTYRQFFRYLPLVLLLGIFACQDTPTAEEVEQGIAPSLPKSASPEEVLREWHRHFDNNRFEAARQLSTEKMSLMLDDLEAILSEMDLDSSIIQTNFLELKCTESGDEATCSGLIKDPELDEIYRDSFFLVRQNGRWLVDLTEDVFEEVEDTDTELFEEF